MHKPTIAQLEKFIDFGMGTSLYQISSPFIKDLGSTPNQWDISQKNKIVPLRKNQKSAWETLENYLPIMAQMGIRHLRFSVEWNHIEPKAGHFNQQAIAHYAQFIKKCQLFQIEPMLTLYHFTQPFWFKQKGGFEHENNIQYFLNYARFVIQKLPSVKLWCSINEPAVEAFMGYLLGEFPPHQHIQFNKAALVLKNMLKAHVDLCEQFKKEIENNQIHLGLVHNILRFESPSKIIQKCLTEPLTRFTDELVMEFMTQGQINYRNIHYKDTREKGNCFFVNIYGNVQVGLMGPTCQENQTMGDMYIALYPESYTLALERAKEVHLPLYITETGIADELDVVRPQFIIEFIRCAIHQIIQGNPIERVYFWTFKDNYEWHLGHQKHFGFFNQDDKPRLSAYLLTWLIQEFRLSLTKHQDTALILENWYTILNDAEEKLKNQELNYFSKWIKL